MKYFDSKQDVLDIQLTPYGKFLHSKGKFDPKFFSFSDNDVLYNSVRGGFLETQNQTNGRIINDTPYTKLIARNDPVKEGATDTTQFENSQKQANLFDSVNAKVNSLGSIDLGSQNGPSLKIYVLEGELLSTANFLTSSITSLSEGKKHHPLNIPQIEMALTYKSSVVDSSKPENIFNLDNRPGALNKRQNYEDPTSFNSDISSRTFSDNGRIVILPQSLMLVIEEENTNNSIDNFELEVYEIMDATSPDTGNYELRKLRFEKSSEEFELKNNVLIEQEELGLIEQKISEIITSISRTDAVDPAEHSPENNLFDPAEIKLRQQASYYFEIGSDYEGTIDTNRLCQHLRLLKARGFALDLPYDCPDLSSMNVTKSDIYASEIISPEKC
jgi:hypothetical protein